MDNEEYEEEEVDQELTDYLDDPIQKKKRTFKEAFEEKEVSETEEDETQQIPCKKKTRDEIYNLWAQKWDKDGKDLLPIVQKLSTMSESEAQAYLACLKAMHSRSVHQHLSSKMLTIVSHIVCHPNDITTPLAMQEDEYLVTGVSLFVNDVLTALGKFGLLILIFLYASASRITHKEERTKKRVVEVDNTTGEAIPSNGMREGRDGEDNTHDKIND
jgi:hypothetical protein